MRVMVIVKATKESEAGELPSQELLTAMMNYNEELVKAGILLAGDGLKPTSKGARVHFDGAERTVIDGPFAETKELIAGYWLWEIGSMEEAIEWVKRCPNPMPGPSDIEIRPLYGLDDFGDLATPEMREQYDRMHEEGEKLAKRP
ncbi:YciI family protein [Mesorhizobium sp. VNQ89]|uniref:YciI family protein n=1 Tax=Mesorhizobium quangtriensis TaxID=3157709 RepID=UPI0032B8040B